MADAQVKATVAAAESVGKALTAARKAKDSTGTALATSTLKKAKRAVKAAKALQARVDGIAPHLLIVEGTQRSVQ